MRVIGDKNQISEDEFDFMISYLSFPQKSIRSELAKLFSLQYIHVYRRYNSHSCVSEYTMLVLPSREFRQFLFTESRQNVPFTVNPLPNNPLFLRP